jgi:hypothetical protein
MANRVPALGHLRTSLFLLYAPEGKGRRRTKTGYIDQHRLPASINDQKAQAVLAWAFC